MFSPIWSAPNGHHLPQIIDKQGNSFDFGNSPIPPWGHLLMRPAQLCQYLYQFTDKETADLMVYYVYNSPHINRFFTEDYIEFINQSAFKEIKIELTFNASINQETQLSLERLYPDRNHFANNGILLILEKSLETEIQGTDSVISCNVQEKAERKTMGSSEPEEKAALHPETVTKIERATEYFNQGKYREAINCYKKAISCNPELIRFGIPINIAHSIILSTDWKEICQNLPKDINYLETSGWLNSLKVNKPINQELKPVPWYTYPAIEFLENKLDKTFQVFEFGSGNSTLWFSERVCHIVSVENDLKWFSYLEKKLPSNVELYLVEEEDRYAAQILKYPEKSFDIIVIDGINRNKCAELALNALKEDGLIVFDNTDNSSFDEGVKYLSEQGFKRIDFYGLVPSYTYKNCTSILFRDDKFLLKGELPSQKQSCLGKSCFQITNPSPARKNENNFEKPKVSTTKSLDFQVNNEQNKGDEWQLKTPVCLIIFKRPDTTQKIFEAIRNVKPPKLLVVADGARTDQPGEAEKCAAARAIINQIDWDCEVLTNYSETNLGCRKRVSTGLNWVFEQVEEAIILEDDCLPHPTFFRFCEELLEKYRHDERVMVISGNNFQGRVNPTEYSYYFSRYNHIWGWASWRRAWRLYDVEMQIWPKVLDSNLLWDILQDSQAVADWSAIFQNSYDGFDTWDVAWTFSCWIHNGLSILPQVNLVSNIGFGREATFTKELSPLANIPAKEMRFPLNHPPFIIRNTQADDLTQKTMFRVHNSATSFQTLSKDVMLQQALTHLNANRNTEALNLLEQLIAANPDMLGLNYGKAIALARLGYTNKAVETLNDLLTTTPRHKKAQLLLKEIRPGSVGDLMQQATQALNASKLDRAFRLLSQAKSLKQPTVGLDYLRATCFMEMNQPGAALQSLHEELRYFPNNTEAQHLLNQLLAQYPQFVSSQIDNAEFQELLRLVRPYTMLSEARLYSLFSLVKGVCEENIPGNIVECGVAGGGSTALMAAIIKRYTKQPRWLYAFDSFEGMPTPTEQDKHNGILADATGWGTGTCAAPEASVREICSKLGVSDIVRTVKGYFQDSLPEMRNFVGMIALLHMDGDWYESTKAILDNLYDRVVNDGFIQVDDYGHWEGCRQAIHEFEASRQIEFDINPIDGTGVWLSCPNQFPINPDLELILVAEFAEDDPVASAIQSQMSPNERFQLYYALRELLPETSSPLRFVEIGSFAGSSLFLTCKALKRTTSQLQGFAVEPGGHPQFYEVLKHIQDDVTHLKMFSDQAAPQLQQIFEQDGELPPFIFVDGDHTYEGVRQDILNYFPLLAPGGIMMFHDYLPPLNDENRDAIMYHHAGNEPGIRQACQELMENTYGCEVLNLPLLYPTDPTQTQAHLPIIPGVFSTIRAYRKPQS